jgi:thioesterase domain-containing protein
MKISYRETAQPFLAFPIIFQALKTGNYSIMTSLSEITGKDVTPVRTTGAQRPLFLIHEIMGEDLWFSLLTPHINPEIPVYGLSAVPLDEPQLQTIEGMATRLIEMMRRFQPQGPYRFAGWSLGGALAYEVAVQLIGQDQSVEFAGVIDADCPIRRRSPKNALALNSHKKTPQSRLIDLCVMGKREVPLTVEQRQTLWSLKSKPDETDFDDLFSRCHEESLLPESLVSYSASETQRYLARLLAHERAIENYVAQPISIPIYLFATAVDPTINEKSARPDPLMGWGNTLSKEQIRLVQVSGNRRSLMDEPHIAELGKALSAAIIGADKHQSVPPEMKYSACVPLQPGNGSRTPIFCVPGAGDNVTGFIWLAGALGQDWPVHGLQPRGVEGNLTPHSTVEAAAAVYLREIEAVRPDGYVHLIGHSFGGWIALEIASRIRASGRSVASLTIIDSEVPGGDGVVGREYTSTGVFRELISVMELASGASLGIDPAALEAEDDTGQLRLLHEGALRVGLMPRRSTPSMLQGPRRAFGSALRTYYLPDRQYPDPLWLALADDTHLDDQANQRNQEETSRGWRLWAPQTMSWRGPGDHFTILKLPHAQTLADWWWDLVQRKKG